jgi:uncharacterized membrane protein
MAISGGWIMLVTNHEITINRPLPEVWNFLMDIANYPMWQSGLVEVHSSNGMQVGSIITFTSVGMGRKFNLKAKVVGNNGHSSYQAVSNRGPVTFTALYVLTAKGDKTLMQMKTELETSIVFKLAESTLQSISDAKTEGDLKSLRALLENKSKV